VIGPTKSICVNLKIWFEFVVGDGWNGLFLSFECIHNWHFKLISVFKSLCRIDLMSKWAKPYAIDWFGLLHSYFYN